MVIRAGGMRPKGKLAIPRLRCIPKYSEVVGFDLFRYTPLLRASKGATHRLPRTLRWRVEGHMIQDEILPGWENKAPTAHYVSAEYPGCHYREYDGQMLEYSWKFEMPRVRVH
jgi:hypothetical protein